MDNLNKENFFNELMEKYPAATKDFCNWIDKYKDQNFWDRLFGNNYRDDHSNWIKFHHIPMEMQIGIIFKYFSENVGRYKNPLAPRDCIQFTISTLLFDRKILIEIIIRFFSAIEAKLHKSYTKNDRLPESTESAE